MATRDQVARHAGVSPSTVSYVISGDRAISDETRERVLEAMRELDYTPNAFARGLAGARKGIIALNYPIQDGGMSPTEVRYLDAAARAAREHGMHMLWWATPPEDLDTLRSLVAQQLVDGVIVMEVEADDPRVPLLQRQHARFVMLGRTAHNDGLDYVDTDFERATYDALEHLVDRGHRRILFLSDPGTALARGLGPPLRISRALAEHAHRLGVEVTSSHVHRTYGGGREAFERFVSTGSTATAVLTFNDQATVGFLHAAQLAGLSIPRDLSMIAMGMGEDAADLSPPITTVTPPVADLSATAVGMLLERIAGRTPVQHHVLLRARLADRGSVTAPTR